MIPIIVQTEMVLRLSFFFSFIFCLTISGQRLRLTHIRVGFDPIFTATMLYPKLDTYKYQIDYHNYECFFELIGPYRISLIGEFGQTWVSMNVLSNRQIYSGKGSYGRIGFNFDLSKPDKNHEFDLGWRLGYSNTDESALLIFKGEYWDNELTKNLVDRNSSFIWGEILLDFKFRIFPKKESKLKDLWVGTNLRVRLNTNKNDQPGYKTQLIPGFGLNTSSTISPGMQFSLFYTIRLNRGVVHRAHHLNHNYEIIEKNHHVYKIKHRKSDANEVDRE
ncbi:MAG: DUF6048 family protein [Bacteroidota bacterium]|nr:DUF6048 family protein [Bacteroidota bacterium]